MRFEQLTRVQREKVVNKLLRLKMNHVLHIGRTGEHDLCSEYARLSVSTYALQVLIVDGAPLREQYAFDDYVARQKLFGEIRRIHDCG